jgi:hypothetical protein
LEYVAGCDDRTVHVWRTSEGDDGSVLSVDNVWGSNIGILGALGMQLDGVVNLDSDNRRLLLQHGSINGFLTSERDGGNVGADDEWGTDERASDDDDPRE